MHSIFIGKFPGRELDRITGKLIQNKAFSQKIIFYEFRDVTQAVLRENLSRHG